jgi:hypothetical protein
MVAALAEAGWHLEASLLGEHATTGRDELLVRYPSTPLLGRRAWISSQLPSRAAAGDVWLDTCELSVMLLVPREPLPDPEGPPPAHNYPPLLSWLATRAVARWQYRGFLNHASIEPRDAPAPPLTPFDRGRIAGEPDTAPATGITRSEAMAYARFFGKSLADLGDWQAARAHLAEPVLHALWASGTMREWVAYSCTSDADRAVLATPRTLDLDPDEALEAEDEGHRSDVPILFGPWDHLDDVGFRSAVRVQSGLLLPERFERVFVGNRRLAAPLRRG